MKRRFSLRPLLAALTLFVLSAAAVPGHAESRAASLLGHIHQASWITEGSGPRLMYVFFDPNCPYCHKLYEELRPYVGKHRIQVRWVPVGILTPSSAGKAAAILQGPHPLKAFYRNENDWNFGPSPLGGIAPLASPAMATLAALHANAALLGSVNLDVVPVSVFRANNGKAYFFSGAPDAAQLAAILKYVR